MKKTVLILLLFLSGCTIIPEGVVAPLMQKAKALGFATDTLLFIEQDPLVLPPGAK